MTKKPANDPQALIGRDAIMKFGKQMLPVHSGKTKHGGEQGDLEQQESAIGRIYQAVRAIHQERGVDGPADKHNGDSHDAEGGKAVSRGGDRRYRAVVAEAK